MRFQTVVVGGYAAAAGLPADDLPGFFADLAALPGVTGFEIPWTGLVGAADRATMYDALTADSRSLLTAIPGTMAQLGADPSFGLASHDSDGRRAALAVTAELRDEVARLAQRFGAPVVAAVELHSAPRIGGGGDDAAQAWLTESLATVAEWDWNGAEILIEHADADTGAHEPVKGFLSLDREIAVAKGLVGTATPVRVAINWGRSVVETRDTGAGAAHVARTAAAGVLGAVMVSGAAVDDGAFGRAWDDQHPPLATTEPSSGLTADDVRATMGAVGAPEKLVAVGVKLGARPATRPVSERVHQFAEILALMLPDLPDPALPAEPDLAVPAPLPEAPDGTDLRGPVPGHDNPVTPSAPDQPNSPR